MRHKHYAERNKEDNYLIIVLLVIAVIAVVLIIVNNRNIGVVEDTEGKEPQLQPTGTQVVAPEISVSYMSPQYVCPENTPKAEFYTISGGEGFGKAVAFLGDINNDGNGDYVVSERGDDPVPSYSSAYLGRIFVISGNNGAPLFELQRPVSTPQITYYLTDQLGGGAFISSIDDVTGDGKEDILVLGRAEKFVNPSYSTTVSVIHLYSGADGVLVRTFDISTLPVGFQYGSIVSKTFAIKDANGDGRQDIAIFSNYNPHIVAIISSNDFSLIRSISNPLLSFYDTAGDLNGDGQTDYIATRYAIAAPGAILATLFVSGTDGALLYNIPAPPAPNGVNSFRAGDFNSDGRDDFVTTTPQPPYIITIKSGADGSPIRSHQFSSSSILYDATTDFNNDHVSDLLVREYTSFKVFSGIDFSEIFSYGFSGGGTYGYYYYAGSGDINNDGYLETIYGPGSGTSIKDVKIFSKTFPANIDFPINGKQICSMNVFTTALLGDVDGDGYDDFAIGGSAALAFFVKIISGRTLNVISTISLAAVPDSLAVGNFDSDTSKELVIGVSQEQFNVGAATYRGKVYIYDNLNTPSPSLLRVLSNTYVAYVSGYPNTNIYFGRDVAVGDLVGNNLDDVLVGAGGDPVSYIPIGGRIFVFDGSNGNLAFANSGGNYLWGFGEQVGTLADLNNDGKREVVATSFYLSPLSPYHSSLRVNVRNIYYVIERILGDARIARSSMDASGDIDNDGVRDLIVHVVSSGNINQIFRETFVISGRTGTRLYKFNDALSVQALIDVNFDGHDDILLTIQLTAGHVYRVISGATGEVISEVPLGLYVSFVHKVSDLNNDGVDEVLISNNQGNFIKSLVGVQSYGFVNPRPVKETMSLVWQAGTGTTPYYNGKLVVSAMPNQPISILGSYGSRMDYFTALPNHKGSYLNANEFVSGFPVSVTTDSTGRAEYSFSILYNDLNLVSPEVFLQAIQGSGNDVRSSNGLEVKKALSAPVSVVTQCATKLLLYVGLCGFPYTQPQINYCLQAGAVANQMRMYNRDGSLAGSVAAPTGGFFTPTAPIIRSLYYLSGTTGPIAYPLTIAGSGTLSMKHKRADGTIVQQWNVHANSNNVQSLVPYVVVRSSGEYLELSAGQGQTAPIAVDICD